MRNTLIIFVLSLCVVSCTFEGGPDPIPPIDRVPIEFNGVSADNKGKNGYYVTINKDSCNFTITISEGNGSMRNSYEITGIEYDLNITTNEELLEFPTIPIIWEWGEIDRLENESDDVIYSFRLDENSSGKKRMMKVYIYNWNYSGNTIIIAQQSYK